MKTTTTVSWNDGKVVEEHIERLEELCSHEPHIDYYNEHGASVHYMLLNKTLKQVYEEEFSDALTAYNAKQKRSDRRMTMDEYMKSVENDTRGKRQTKKVNGKRVVNEDAARQGKQNSYEVTIKIGSTARKKDDKGKTLYDKNGKHIRTEKLPRKLTQKALKRYTDSFQKENPNFRLVKIAFHGDEGFYNRKGKWEYSTDHLHIEFVPIAHGFKQGLAVQNSMNRAMKEMGFNGPDCYHEWAVKEQERLEKIVLEEYQEYCKQHPDYLEKHGELEIYHPVADKLREGGKDKDAYVREEEADERLHEAQRLKDFYREKVAGNDKTLKEQQQQIDDNAELISAYNDYKNNRTTYETEITNLKSEKDTLSEEIEILKTKKKASKEEVDEELEAYRQEQEEQARKEAEEIKAEAKAEAEKLLEKATISYQYWEMASSDTDKYNAEVKRLLAKAYPALKSTEALAKELQREVDSEHARVLEDTTKALVDLKQPEHAAPEKLEEIVEARAEHYKQVVEEDGKIFSDKDNAKTVPKDKLIQKEKSNEMDATKANKRAKEAIEGIDFNKGKTTERQR